MDRPSFPTIYMNLAKNLAARSTCSRLKVGCVITDLHFRQVLAIGYNGNFAGGPNQCDCTTPGACGCLHAEDNACIKCPPNGRESRRVFLTHSPCVQCAKRLINLGGIFSLHFASVYRDTNGLKLIAENAPIYIYQLDESGRETRFTSLGQRNHDH